jgi:hypothetical protein
MMIGNRQLSGASLNLLAPARMPVIVSRCRSRRQNEESSRCAWNPSNLY